MKSTVPPTLMDHIHELRGRLLWPVAIFGVAGIVGYLERVDIIRYLQQPLHQKLYYTTPTGSFESIMQVCALVGLLAALPALVYNLLRFIEPALPKPFGKRRVASTIILSFGLAVGGAAFAYYVSLPSALHFFGSVSSGSVQPLISVNQYFRFVFVYLGTFAVVFQLPLLLSLADHVTPLGPKGLRKARKWVILGAFGVALVSPTTPDPLSQAILALPIIALYELSLITLWLRHQTHRLKRRSQPQPVATPSAGAPPRPAAPHAPATRRLRPVAPAIINLRDTNLATPDRPLHVLDLRNLAS